MRNSGYTPPSAGAQGPQGVPGPKGDTGAGGPKGDAGAQGPAGAVGATGPQGAKGDTGATGAQGLQGPAGLPSLQFIGNVTVSETLLLALSLGMRRKALALTGVATTDKLVFAALTPCAAGCEAVNVYPTAANQVTVAYYTPALAIGAIVNLPIAVYRVI